MLVFRKLKKQNQNCSNTMRMSTKRKILKYDESGYTVKTCVEQEENLLYYAQKILTYKNLFYQNQYMLKRPNFPLWMSLQCKLWRQNSAWQTEWWILSPEVQRKVLFNSAVTCWIIRVKTEIFWEVILFTGCRVLKIIYICSMI